MKIKIVKYQNFEENSEFQVDELNLIMGENEVGKSRFLELIKETLNINNIKNLEFNKLEDFSIEYSFDNILILIEKKDNEVKIKFVSKENTILTNSIVEHYERFLENKFLNIFDNIEFEEDDHFFEEAKKIFLNWNDLYKKNLNSLEIVKTILSEKSQSQKYFTLHNFINNVNFNDVLYKKNLIDFKNFLKQTNSWYWTDIYDDSIDYIFENIIYKLIPNISCISNDIYNDFSFNLLDYESITNENLNYIQNKFMEISNISKEDFINLTSKRGEEHDEIKSIIEKKLSDLTMEINEFYKKNVSESLLNNSVFYLGYDSGKYFINIKDNSLKNSSLKHMNEYKSSGYIEFFYIFIILKWISLKDKYNKYIILLDEPGNFLHPTIRFKLIELFEKISSRDRKIIFTSHNLEMFGFNVGTIFKFKISEDNKIQILNHYNTIDWRYTMLEDVMKNLYNHEYDQKFSKNDEILIVEGYTDKIIYSKIIKNGKIKIFAGSGKGNDKNKKLLKYISYMLVYDLKINVLIDNDDDSFNDTINKYQNYFNPDIVNIILLDKNFKDAEYLVKFITDDFKYIDNSSILLELSNCFDKIKKSENREEKVKNKLDFANLFDKNFDEIEKCINQKKLDLFLNTLKNEKHNIS
ncbi:AAA family ATPase [Spiroplasma turonicum]|uniref:Endonuclease GajA/Old nuclease/RecF-like AAA domain-containing protein n=1 Tax=Spiroplasma turonicum TaxID=216946 RepID=A0A0K1P6K9_9MOLU|nr:AAA family ATPase [Spiroplasma turonicum]AKU79844.1 hypothetical protein STURON_00598 [Spiroplasma turonicum]ALX70860.1 hypothetical protein STURO_v1c05940 [Spiroplasma turonicum]